MLTVMGLNSNIIWSKIQIENSIRKFVRSHSITYRHPDLK
jgi:hypothetical protein